MRYGRYRYGYRYGFGYFYALRFVGKVAGIVFIGFVLLVIAVYAAIVGNGPATSSSAPALSTSTAAGGN